MNIHERSLNVFMNCSWMFLNNRCDIHEMSAWSSEHNVHEIELFMNEQKHRLFNNEPDKPATLKLSSWSSQTQLVLMFMNGHELFMKIH